jgi:mRNA interferase MazF
LAFDHGDQPPRKLPSIRSAPRIGQVYYCDFQEDALLPEFWKRRPVVIVSGNATLYGIVTIVPLTTKSQPDNKLAWRFVPTWLEDGEGSWAICSHVTSVATSRLSLIKGKAPKVIDEDLQNILRLVRTTIPAPRDQPLVDS